jgi:predicted permease
MHSGISWLDVKLALRMLRKHLALTLIGGLGMAVAIAVALGSLWYVNTATSADVPLHEGERVVSVQYWDAAAGRVESRVLRDFAAWREEARTIVDFGAWRNAGHNLIGRDGQAEPVNVAEISASGFQVARVAPLLGRYLVADDERPDALPVVVIGHDVWRNRFGGDRDVVGRTLQLGRTPHTIVGVMPEGFAFPQMHHYWTPLRRNPSEYERRDGPAIYVFGRLAPGAALEEAKAELAAIGQRTAAAFPETHARLRLHVMPYTHPFGDVDTPAQLRLLYLIQLLVSLLLVLVAANVAVLVYARTAARLGEITVRSALGASRARIVGQLFVEGLVLSLGAAVLALGLTWFGLQQLRSMIGSAQILPFWFDFDLSPSMVLYAVGLAVLGAVIMGVVPALQATGSRLQSSLRQLGGGTGMQLGKTWTTLIVVQVAVAVAALPIALFTAWAAVRPAASGLGPVADHLLIARVALVEENAPGAVRDSAAAAALLADRQAELVRRLKSEPGISDVVLSSQRPGITHGTSIDLEPRRPGGEPARAEADYIQVEPGFFDLFDIPVLAGRTLQEEDAAGRATAVVANRSFVNRVLGGGEALGRRFRYVEGRSGPPGLPPWGSYEIVGVVEDYPVEASRPGHGTPILYHPTWAGQLNGVVLLMRTRDGTPEQLARRVREITTRLDPTLRLSYVRSHTQLQEEEERGRRLGALAIVVATLSVLLLSSAGVHALISFTVTRRRREIGIRTALGAQPRQILGSIFAQALRKLGLGVLVGLGAAVLLDHAAGGELLGGTGAVLLPTVAVLMLGVGLLAALGPARRGLRIQPVEALRADG